MTVDLLNAEWFDATIQYKLSGVCNLKNATVIIENAIMTPYIAYAKCDGVTFNADENVVFNIGTTGDFEFLVTLTNGVDSVTQKVSSRFVNQLDITIDAPSSVAAGTNAAISGTCSHPDRPIEVSGAFTGSPLTINCTTAFTWQTAAVTFPGPASTINLQGSITHAAGATKTTSKSVDIQ